MANTATTADERLIPTPGIYDFTGYELIINGSRLDNPAYSIQSITVYQEVNVVPNMRIVISDGDVASETFSVSESGDFIPGNKIELKLGRDGKLKSLFKGIIVRHALRAKEHGSSYLQVDCKDESVQLTLGRQNRYFQNTLDSDALKTVLGKHAGNIDSTTIKLKELVQYYCTDWDFALSRAEMNGMVLLASEGKVNIVKPKVQSSAALVLVNGATIEEIDIEMDARTQWNQVTATSWNYANQSLITGQSSTAPITEAGNLSGKDLSGAVSPEDLQLRHSGLISEPELKQWSDAFLLKSRFSKIRGRLKIKGSPDVNAGDTIELKGLGQRFNGKVFTSGVRHELQEGIWTTQLQFGLSPEWFHHKENLMETPAAGLLPGVSGLQIGTVVQLANDPDGEHRILVKMPAVDNKAEGTWARMASLDAGENRGYFFRPDIGDEVIVGFVNSDPRFAVVLGMLHSSAKPAHETASDDNYIKSLQTRSKLKTTYDDQYTVMQMETPNKNMITLGDKSNEEGIVLKDQFGNSISMNKNGITIKSATEIVAEAATAFKQKAGTEMTMEALSISEKANTTMEISGQAKTTVKASGIVEIQGGIVKIN